MDSILSSAASVEQITKMKGFDMIPGIANMIPELRKIPGVGKVIPDLGKI